MSLRKKFVKTVLNKGTRRVASRLVSLVKAVMKKNAASRLVSLVEKSANEPEPETESEENDKKKKKPTFMSKIMPVLESIVDRHTV